MMKIKDKSNEIDVSLQFDLLERHKEDTEIKRLTKRRRRK